MKPETLKFLDPSLSSIAQLSAYVLGQAGGFRARHGADALIVRPGGMGDLILFCIALEDLGIPFSSVNFLIERRSAVWAEHLGLKYVCYDNHPLGTLGALTGRYRLVVNSEQRFGLAQAVGLAARGWGGKLVCFDTTRGAHMADLRIPYDPCNTHEVFEFRKLLAAAFDRDMPAAPLQRKRRTPPGGLALVGIAGLQSESRALPVETWVKFAQSWSAGRRLGIVAASSDVVFAQRLADQLGGVPVTSGKFPEICDAIAVADDLLTVDGGMVHVASYYGVPVTAIFTSGREKKWAPMGANSKLIRRQDLACQPCTIYGQVPPCTNAFACKALDYKRHIIPVFPESAPSATSDEAGNIAVPAQ